MKKTTLAKTIKAFQVARSETHMKPVLQCINVSDTPKHMLACTNGYRLHVMQYLHTPVQNMLPAGSYNPDTLEKVDEQYPDYTQIFKPTADAPHTDIATLQRQFMACGLVDIKAKAIVFLGKKVNQVYIKDALTFLDHITILTKDTNVRVYTDENIPQSSLAIALYEDQNTLHTNPTAYAIIMPLNN